MYSSHIQHANFLSLFLLLWPPQLLALFPLFCFTFGTNKLFWISLFPSPEP